MVGTPAFDTVLDACGHEHRRIVLRELLDRERSVSMADLTDAIVEHDHHAPPAEVADETVTQIRVGLHHVHLPKLAEAGFVHHDAERKVVEPTPQLERKASHLSALLAMEAEQLTT